MRERPHTRRVRWRRWRLLRAHARVFEVPTGKNIGFSPLMAAYQSAARDGIFIHEDAEIAWYWPETDR